MSLQLKVGKESLDRWEAAAAQSSCTLTDWIASSLDKIAELRLSDSAR